MSFTVYVDGSGTTGGPAGIGFVAYQDDVEFLDGSLPLRRATNQQAEILAAAYGLDAIPALEDVTVISDSEYVVKGFSEWLTGWIARGWRTSSGRTVANQPYWLRLITATERHRVVAFRWTRGHVGVEGNERADKLAGAARRAALDAETAAAAT